MLLDKNFSSTFLNPRILSKYFHVYRVDTYVAFIKTVLMDLENEIQLLGENRDENWGIRKSKLFRSLEVNKFITSYKAELSLRKDHDGFKFSHVGRFQTHNLLHFYLFNELNNLQLTKTSLQKTPSPTLIDNRLGNLSSFVRNVRFKSLYSSILKKESEIDFLIDDGSDHVFFFDSPHADYEYPLEYSSSMNGDYRYLQTLANYLLFIGNKNDFAKQIYETIKKHIKVLVKLISHYYHAILVGLSRKYRFRQGIGKGKEGYIPFCTWARGSINAQLVMVLNFIDKLSQNNSTVLEISYGG